MSRATSRSTTGDMLIKTYYDMAADVGEGDDPYEFLLGKESVISHD